MGGDQVQALASLGEAPMVGDHLALDMLNTEALSDGNPVDFWNSNQDVLTWLKRFATDPSPKTAPADLLAQGKALRALARQLIIQHKDGDDGDIGELNEYLHSYLSAPHFETRC
ncbi:MAG: ABATE domain-containing protein [Cellvibrio sp.]|uniref:ABATE domain-containing protein n=1 Tax=Cellvibrio sp. TaxID=1965322 RepID=UPI0031B211DC